MTLLSAMPIAAMYGADVRFINNTDGVTAARLSNVVKIVLNQSAAEVTASDGKTTRVENSAFNCFTINKNAGTTSIDTAHGDGMTLSINGNILTATSAQGVDRMELIELNGYTLDEKREIARRYLVPKKVKENGLPEGLLEITDGALTAIAEGYTMEAGVRNLERQIGSVCRKIAVRYAENESMECQVVDENNLESILGVRRYNDDHAHLDGNEVGAATGLAWTSVGGTTLTIEVSAMPGKGEILLTGKLGDVMKESARAAISYIRAHADEYGIASDVFSETDIHIHVPEGATPKDGPSAGITMATAILSAFTHKPVRKDIAMTGEITLRGKVLPIGGLKEKALAAHRVGIKNIIIPKENERDEQEIPENVRGDLHFIPASEVGTVFRNAIVGL